jgi:hypothetical protein
MVFPTIPVDFMAFVVMSNNGVTMAFVGSEFGNIHGFTHFGAMGIGKPLALAVLDEDGLNASATAVLPTGTMLRPAARAKNVGKSVRSTVTETWGLTTKLGWPALGKLTLTCPGATVWP